jgi:2-polyprenyl-3-methyl-5-hydroxy-6-metoxy-1,4-benzoquinol methylase
LKEAGDTYHLNMTLGGNAMSDKLPKDCTMAERRALYSKVRLPPTTDREARNLERVLWLFREIPRIKPKLVLDLGCESGFVTRWLVDEPYVESLHGVDPCQFSIDHARVLVKKRLHPEKAVYDVEGWEDQPECSPIHSGYDTVVCFEVIEHFLLAEGIELLKKIHSLLDAGGTAFLCTPTTEGRYGLKNPDPWHLKIYTDEELAKLVKEVTGCAPECSEDDPDFIMLKWRKS